MQEFLRKFTQLNGARGRVILKHCLFGRQVFYCDELQTINDDERVGLLLKEQEIFMYKSNVKFIKIDGNMYKLSDGRLIITVNKL